MFCTECMARGWATDATYLVAGEPACGHHGRSRPGAVPLPLADLLADCTTATEAATA
jgi:hypothetical protein